MRLSSDLRLTQLIRAASHLDWNHLYDSTDNRGAAFFAVQRSHSERSCLRDDRLVEITFTTVAAYGSFLLVDHSGLSGILSTITAGLVVGNLKSLDAISEPGKVAAKAFSEYAAFVVNSSVFLMI